MVCYTEVLVDPTQINGIKAEWLVSYIQKGGDTNEKAKLLGVVQVLL